MSYEFDNFNNNTRCIVSYVFKELTREFIDELNKMKSISLIFNNYTSISMLEDNSNKFSYDEAKRLFWRGSRFNKCIDLLAETKLKSIEFGVNFDKSISNLPETLETLILSSEFNHPLDNLPTNLVYLSLANCLKFDCNLDYLPEGLETLILPENYYYRPIDNLPIETKVLNLTQYQSNNNNLVFEY